MNVVFLLDRFPQNGGVERVTITLANALSHKGIAILIISKIGDKPELFDELHTSIKYFGVDNCDYNGDYIAPIINSFNADVVINQGAYFETDDIIASIRRNCNVPIISVIHNEPDYFYKSAIGSIGIGLKGFIKYIFRPIYLARIRRMITDHYKNLEQYSEKIVLLSQSYHSEFLNWINLNKSDKIITIQNPIDLPYYDVAYSKSNSLIFVGRLDEKQKKVSRLIRIWSKIYSNFPNWVFKIYGDGPDCINYKSDVVKLNIKNISFKGFTSNMAEIYHEASILVMASEFEGLPLVILEAMAHGCIPVIYNSFSAAEDIINNGENGLLIENGNEEQFVNALSELMSDFIKREALSIGAIQSSKKYSIDCISNVWLEVLNSNGRFLN